MAMLASLQLLTVGVAFVFALIGGWMNRRFGRRIAIIVSSFFFGLGAIMLAIARTFIELLLGRAVLGIGLGTLGLTSSFISMLF